MCPPHCQGAQPGGTKSAWRRTNMAKVNLTDRTVSAAKAAPGERLEIWDALTPGLALRVTDRGVKSWILRYRTLDGRQPRF